MTDAEALHTAARRWCSERADRWRAQYDESARKIERPAKGGLLGELGLTTPGHPREAPNLVPHYKVLDAILVEIERRTGHEFSSLPDVRHWLMAAARTAYEEESRPPDLVIPSMKDAFSSDVRERIQELGPRAKVVVGGAREDDRARENRTMEEECEAFGAYVSALEGIDLAAVAPLPSRRTLSDEESQRLWSLLKSQWGVDGFWYPLDRSGHDTPPPDAVAFQAAPFWDNKLVEALQGIFRAAGLVRVYELREDAQSADREVDLELLRPWYNLNEGFWLDDTGDWVIYASHDGSVTVAGARLLPALKQVWRNWAEFTYSPPELGVERLVAPDVTTTSLRVEPPT